MEVSSSRPVTYNVGYLLGLRKKLYANLYSDDCKRFHSRLGDEMTLSYWSDEHVDDVVSAILPMVTDVIKADDITVGQSLDALLNTSTSLSSIKRALWILAGSAYSLRKGIPVVPDSDITEPLWTPVECTGWGESKKFGFYLKFVCLAGQFATSQVFRPVPDVAWWYIRIQMLGLPKYKKGITPKSIFGVRAWVLMTSKGEFKRTHLTNGFANYNRKKLSDRLKPCLKGFNKLCHECHLGIDLCPRGVRLLSLHKVTKESVDGKAGQDT